MIDPKTCRLVACATVIEELLPLMPPQLSPQVLDFVLHSNPNRLRVALQNAIGAAPPEIRTILLGFGLCTKAVVGLKTGGHTVVISGADDCITIFLGSAAHNREKQHKETGTLYMTKGWIESGTPLDEQREIMVRKYGEKRAEFLFKKMRQGYKRLAFINIVNHELEQYRGRSREIASRLALRYEEIQGKLIGRSSAFFAFCRPGL